MATTQKRRRVANRMGALALLALIAVPAAVVNAREQASNAAPTFGFSATVTTSGVRQSVVMPSFLAVGDTIAELGAPVAQAVLNSGAVSEAFASNPYPGEVAVTAGDLVGGASGVPNQLPPYPAFVKASYPNQPEASTSVPGFSLAALASPRQARADGSIGVSPDASVLEVGRSVGSAEARIGDAGDVEATGVSILRNVDIGGSFTIGELRSELRGVLGPDGKPSWTSTLSMSGASIAGIGVVLTPDGLAVADQHFATPIAPADPLLELLRQQGIDVRVVEAGPEVGDETSMSSRALRVAIRAAGTPATPATEFRFFLGSIVGRLTAGGVDAFAQATATGEVLGAASPPEPGNGGGNGVAFGGVRIDGPAANEPRSSANVAVPDAPGAMAARPRQLVLARDLQSEVQLPYLLLAFAGFTAVACVASWRRWIAPIATGASRF